MNRPVSHRYEGTAMIARLSSLRVAAEPGPRYRASGAAAARPRAHLARPPLPPQAAVGGPGRCWRPSTMHIDIACGPPPSDAQRTLFTSGLLGHAVGIWPRGARNAAPCTFTTDSIGQVIGNSSSKDDPWPGALVTWTRPSWASTTHFTNASPS